MTRFAVNQQFDIFWAECVCVGVCVAIADAAFGFHMLVQYCGLYLMCLLSTRNTTQYSESRRRRRRRQASTHAHNENRNE